MRPLCPGKSPKPTSSVAPQPTTPAAATMQYPIRSCVSCKTRRVRCDRRQPSCGNCARARGLGQECVYPTGRGRAPKRRRTLHGAAADEQQQIAERLTRLETMIQRVGHHDQADVSLGTAATADDSSTTTTRHQDRARNVVTSPNSPVEEHIGRLKVTETNSHYLNDTMWKSLAEEVEELRDLLLKPSSDDEVDSEDATTASPLHGSMETPPPPNPTTVLFGLGAPAGSLGDLHPSLAQAASLFAAFCENVAPVMRVMHLPTLTRQYWDAASSSDKLDRNTEALVFTSNYVSVGTMSDDQCTSALGKSRQAALACYRTAAEQSLSRAHLLATRSPAVLQAAVFYIEALKNEKAGQSAVRSLVVLVQHLARSMGLHRDGDAYGLPPFEAEMRRRLWWYICILDHRTAEACGDEHAVRPHSFDTRLPLHVDDGDLAPEITILPPEHEGFGDMTFCLVRYETLQAVWRLNEDTSLVEKQTAINELEHRLESRYLRQCDPEVPFQLKVLLSARMIIKRLCFVAYWPLREKNINPPMQQSPTTTTKTVNGGARATRDQLFAAAVDLLEAAANILANPALAAWTWHAQTYSHWHAVAFVLHELRRRPASAECERAWRYTCVVCETWLAGSNGTNLGRPIKRLWENVRREREIRNGNERADATRIGTTPLMADCSSNNGERDGEDTLDSFLDMLLPELGNDNDLYHTLMDDHDMAKYFHFGEDDILDTAAINTFS
ncbi:uncharacterized protein PG986_011682 [Apiospora aurea]|uniref:Zn(2)-C6 fungal-type domain-containing protein n=1 Tax=Apiospora aurea TaxID=335848 RepID=A0ABR1PXU4_9PEZI